jgi:chromosome partitioning protein
MIVALLNQQSGVGKTTLALHLAGVWACQGRCVAVVDADPDACAVEWSELRAQETLPSRFTVTADFVLVPVQPPPLQGSAFVETLRLANGIMTVRPQLRVRLVLNRCNARTSVMRERAKALADYDPPALTSSITEHAVFADAMESGRLAFELPHSRAAVQEITALAEVDRIVS